MTVKEFTEKYKPMAVQNEEQTGVPYLVTLGQAALESGWGKHAPSNNFFGIKAGKSWTGKVQLLNTKEFINGKMVTIKDKFRAYDTPLDCFKDHAELLKKRWDKAFKYKDPIEFIYSVQNDHKYKYATDPDYVSKMRKIINMIRGIA